MRIGHSSINENGTVSGGKKGDQNEKEVCIREWYSKPWDLVLRCIDSQKAELMAIACEQGCANNNIGYDQPQRNTLDRELQKVGYDMSKVDTPCSCDCSSFMTDCGRCADIKIPDTNGNAPTTSTMERVFKATGMFEVLKDKKYTTKSEYLKRGDILVKAGSHTVMVLDNGSAITTNNNNIDAVDISKYNTITDYKQMAKEIPNVIIRIGYRSYEKGIITEDPLFKKHIANCLGNGMNVGIYFYDQSINEQEAIEQANWVIKELKGYTIKLPIFIDSEYSNKDHNGRADNISVLQRTKNILAFCNVIQQNGYPTGVYASDSWFKSMVDFSQLKHLLVWCARYSTNKPTIDKFDIWQCGSQMFNWANGAIDINYIYNLTLNENNGLNGANTASQPYVNIVSNDDIKNVVTASSLNIRKSTSTLSKVVGNLSKGDIVEIIGYANNWFMIGNDKWVSAEYIKTKTAKINANSLNYRSGAGTNNSILGQYKRGDIVQLLNKITVSNTIWYLCRLNNKFGWCNGNYLSFN